MHLEMQAFVTRFRGTRTRMGLQWDADPSLMSLVPAETSGDWMESGPLGPVLNEQAVALGIIVHVEDGIVAFTDRLKLLLCLNVRLSDVTS